MLVGTKRRKVANTCEGGDYTLPFESPRGSASGGFDFLNIDAMLLKASNLAPFDDDPHLKGGALSESQITSTLSSQHHRYQQPKLLQAQFSDYAERTDT